MVDIANADSAELTKLYGIGPVYASRIVKYRELLGGFVSIQQLTEVYGISDSLLNTLLPNIHLDSSDIRTIPVNTSDQYGLRKHPYISNALATAIINYREQHGTYGSLGDLRNLYILDSANYERIIPYLSLE